MFLHFKISFVDSIIGSEVTALLRRCESIIIAAYGSAFYLGATNVCCEFLPNNCISFTFSLKPANHFISQESKFGDCFASAVTTLGPVDIKNLFVRNFSDFLLVFLKLGSTKTIFDRIFAIFRFQFLDLHNNLLTDLYDHFIYDVNYEIVDDNIWRELG